MSHVRLEIERPTAGVFTLDSSALDGPDALVAPGDTGTEWEAIECEATGITVERGGTREGLGASVEVGVLTARFKDAVSPIQDAGYRPGRAVRLTDTATDTTLFTGTADDFQIAFDKRDQADYVNLRVLDAVTALVGTPRAGADGPEPWPARFRRLLASSPVPYVAPEDDEYSEVMFSVNGPQLLADSVWSGAWVNPPSSGRIEPSGAPATSRTRTLAGLVVGVEYTFTILVQPFGGTVAPTVTIDTDWMLNHYTVESPPTTLHQLNFVAQRSEHTVTLADAVQVPSIWNNFLSRRSQTLWAAPIVHESDLASHLDIAANSAGVGWAIDRDGVLRVTEPGSEPVAHFSDVHDAGDPLHVCYTHAAVSYDTAAVANSIVLNNHSRRYAGDAVEGYAVPALPATVTDATPTVQWPVAPSRGVRIALEIMADAPAYARLYSTGKPTLSNTRLHPARWTRIELLDVASGGEANYLVLGPEIAGQTVNMRYRNVEVTKVTGEEADDTTLGPFSRFASIATWGARRGEIETAIYTGDDAPWPDHAGILAGRLLDRHAAPEPIVTGLTFNALDHPSIAAGIDVNAEVDVTRRGLTKRMTIVGITHEITPKTWTTTLTFKEA